MSEQDEAKHALSTARVIIHRDRFVLAGIEAEAVPDLDDVLRRLLEGPKPFFVFRDSQEITLIFADDQSSGAAIHDTVRIEEGWRLLTFSPELEMTLVGFIALVGRILANAGVSILALSSFSRDHVLIKEDRLEAALDALKPHVAGIDR